MRGIQTSLAQNFKMNSGYLKTDNIDDYKDIIKLLKQIPRQLEQIQILLQKVWQFRSILKLASQLALLYSISY